MARLQELHLDVPADRFSDHPAPIEEPISVMQDSWWTGVGAVATIGIQKNQSARTGLRSRARCHDQEDRREFRRQVVAARRRGGCVANQPEQRDPF